ncbi:MAG TPA: tyrosine-type recombinase/integrase, partial [Acidimicrobiales bacterium]|nr:tyrosine-type recombinase/integrase [Acidimicrobiales bacterium]
MTLAAPIVQGFFTHRLAQQRVSAHTVTSYRDCLRLLFRFAKARTGKPPSQLDLSDLDAELIGAFLDHLEVDRRNGIDTRNLRLTAIHSMFRYAQLQCPEHAALIARVLAIPTKRPDTTTVSYLTGAETDALLAAPDRSTTLGQRDHALILVATQTGLRVSELTALNCGDITFGTDANVHTKGKGRKERHTPLIPATAKLLRAWLNQRAAAPDDPLFATRNHRRLSTDAVRPHRQARCRHSQGMRITPLQAC